MPVACLSADREDRADRADRRPGSLPVGMDRIAMTGRHAPSIFCDSTFCRSIFWGSVFCRLLPGTLAILAGCNQPRRIAVETHPPGTLKVRYEPTTSAKSCLVASVVMAANYVENRTRFTEPRVRRELEIADQDESKVAHLAAYLRLHGLDLIALKGQRSGNPPCGLAYWLRRGFPPICIINKIGKNADYNHAVVVIGFNRPDADPADDDTVIYYLDPSSPKQLESGPAARFDEWWSAGERALLIVTTVPK